MGLILTFALQSGVYVSTISDTVNGLALGIATTFLPGDTDPATISTPYVLLDKFNDAASEQVADIMKEASIFRLDLALAAALFSIGSVAFLCVALFVVTLSKLLMTFVVAVGPLFVLCLAWRPTARFFDSWLSMLLNTVVLTWFVFFALGLSNYVGVRLFQAIHDGGTFLGGNFNVLGEATRYCVLMILMAIVCFQAPSLASALTGGAAVQHGLQMIQNATMIFSLRSAAAGRAGNAGSQGGGMIRPGLGLSHAAGRIAGGFVHQGFSASRVAAYKLAALRGRAG